jgi:hypothetical protein
MAYIDYKVSIWRRVQVKNEVTEDPKALQDLIEKVKNCLTIDFDIKDMLDFTNDEFMLDTEECLYPEDNGNQYTIELYNDEYKILSNNQPNE